MKAAVKTIDETAPTFASLLKFLDKPIRLCGDNYRGAPDAYRADRRRIVRDRQDARVLIGLAIAWGAPASALQGASSRLSWSAANGWTYVPGQYYQTEVCAAVANAVSIAIIDARPGPDRVADVLRQLAGTRSGRRLARWFR